MNDALDFALAANDGIHFAFACDFSQIAAKSLKRRRLDFALLLGGRLSRHRFAWGRIVLRGEIRIQFLQNLLAGLFDVHIKILENARCDAVPFTEQAQQNVLGADVGMVEGLGLLLSEGEHLLYPGRVGDVPHHLLIGARANLLFHFEAHRVEVEAELLQHVHSHDLPQLDEPKQEVFGADDVVVKPVGLLARQRQHLLGARGKVVHGFLIAHIIKMQLILRFVQSSLRRRGRPGNGAADGPQAIAQHVGAEHVSFLGRELF